MQSCQHQLKINHASNVIASSRLHEWERLLSLQKCSTCRAAKRCCISLLPVGVIPCLSELSQGLISGHEPPPRLL